MNLTQLLTEKEEQLASCQTQALSHSRVNRYLQCPEQYRLYYVEKLRPILPPASLVFGQIIHQVLGHFFSVNGNPAELFLEMWDQAKLVELHYSSRESWEKLKASGQGLIEKFFKEELHRFGRVFAVEKEFRLHVTSLQVPFVGAIDLVAEVDKEPTLVDFKTSSTSYEEHEITLSDQLSAYKLALPGVERIALCVLLKTKEPQIQWFFTQRTGDVLTEYLAKVEYIGEQIHVQRFYKRPGKWCSWCDYLPVCKGDKQKTQETLVQVV